MSTRIPATVAVSRPNLVGFLVVLALVMAIALLLPVVANRGLVFIAGILLINAIYGMGFNLLFSTVGILSFGQAAFFAAGAYTAAMLMLQLGSMPYALVLLSAGLMGAFLAFLIGILALRRTVGVYFAILTLAFGELLQIVLSKNNYTGRNDGLPGIRRPTIELGPYTLDLSSGDDFYYLIVVVCALLFALLWWISHSHLGRRFQSVRQDDMRAAFLGINVFRTRLLGLVLAGGITGVAGGLYAPWTQIVTPELAQWSNSAYPILFTLLGGAAFFWGPLVGAVVFAGIDYALRAQVGATDLVTGLLLLGVVLAMPGGVLGLLSGLRARVAVIFGGQSGRDEASR